MEEQLAQVLANTQLPQEGPRKQAEIDLLHARSAPEFPLALANIAVITSLPVEIRQASLTLLRKFVEDNWSPDGTAGVPIPLSDATKEKLKTVLLELVLGPEDERKVKLAASVVVSKIAAFDFPDNWKQLLPTILGVMTTGSDTQLYGALRILHDLVDESLTDEQFFGMARDIIKTCYDVAVNENRKQAHRALAILVFRGTFDLMDMVKDDHKKEVRAFADEVLRVWLPFFEQAVQTPLPERGDSNDSQPSHWNGPIALKTQVVKTLVKIKCVFPALLLPQSIAFFTITWEDIAKLKAPYHDLFVANDAQGRLEDVDGLPFTLDFLILDHLDFLNQCIRAQTVQKQLEGQLNAHASTAETPWVLELMNILVSFSQISQEEEQLWDIDVSLYLAEETSVSSNYTARTACGDLLIKVGEWLDQRAFEGLFAYTKTLFTGENTDWRQQEAALFLFTVLIGDFLDCGKTLPEEISSPYLELVQYAINRQDEPLLRARGYLVAGSISQIYKPAGVVVDRAIESVTRDPSELVQVACIKALDGFAKSGIPLDRQVLIVNAIQNFLDGKDLTELEDADDLLVTLLETLRTTIRMDIRIAIQPDSKAIDLLFLIGKHGASNFQVTMIVNEALEDIAGSLPDSASYTALCTKVLPSLAGAFDVANVTDNDPLVTLATELLVCLAQHGSEPLPAGFVASTLPKLTRHLMHSVDGEVLRPGAETVKFMLMHDHHQVFGWHDENGRSGLEVCLHIIDRLLGPAIEDNAASEVGGLTAELVEKAGHERLGPYLSQLLTAVAVRLDSAQTAPSIQSLLIVFARLSLAGASDVVDFLSQIEVNGQKGLHVVLNKWLDNSVIFAGYDEIRQNVIALSKLYSLNDQRIANTNVKGDLIITNSTRIMTRSRAKETPEQYTVISAQLKILKVLVEELLSASGVRGASDAAAAAAAAGFAEAESDDGDEGWEDDGDTLDLSLGSTRNELMSFLDNTPRHNQDGETQAYLTEFFLTAARENTADFQNWYNLLTDDEKAKLNELAAH